MSDQPNSAWANPTPAALVALSGATFCFFALLTGKVSHEALPLLGCILIGGFVVQLLTALLDLKSGSSGGGNAFLMFSCLIMLVSGLEAFFKATGGVDARIDGWLWIAITISLILWAPGFTKGPFFLFAIVIVLIPAAGIIALTDLQLIPAATFSPIAGWLLLLGGIIGLYLAAALLVNGIKGKTFYPNPMMGMKK